MQTASWITGRTSAATMENVSVEHVSARKEKTQRRHTAESSASVTTSAVTAPTTSFAEVMVSVCAGRVSVMLTTQAQRVTALDTSVCLASNNQICNGRGICVCGVCSCTDPNFMGLTCEMIKSSQPGI